MMTTAKTPINQTSAVLMLALAMMASLWIPTLTVPATITLPALA